MRCRTREGELKLAYQGKRYLLDPNGLDLPADLAESIRGHVNVIVGPDPPAAEPVEEPEPKRKKRSAFGASSEDE